jgi:hypothetical protein
MDELQAAFRELVLRHMESLVEPGEVVSIYQMALGFALSRGLTVKEARVFATWARTVPLPHKVMSL